MTINRIHRVFTLSTSCLNNSTCCDCRDGAADALGVNSGRSGLCLVFIRQQLGFRVFFVCSHVAAARRQMEPNLLSNETEKNPINSAFHYLH